MVHLHVDNVGQLKQDNCLYSRVTQKKVRLYLRVKKKKICELLQLFKPSVHLYLWPNKHIFHICGFFVIATWRCWGTWLQNRSIHMHNRWVHECRGRPAASGVQPTVKIIQYPLTSAISSSPNSFFSTFVEKPFLSLSGQERIKTLLADELSAHALCWTVAINQASCPLSL